MSDEKLNVDKFMNDLSNEQVEDQKTGLDKEFDKYCKLYEEKFGKRAYIAEPNGTKEQTISAIKTCLEKNEDLLDSLLYPDNNGNAKKGLYI